MPYSCRSSDSFSCCFSDTSDSTAERRSRRDSRSQSTLVKSQCRTRSSKRDRKKKRYKAIRRKILVNVSRWFPILAAMFAVGYTAYLLADPANWKTNYDAEDDEKLRREKARGAFVSVLIGLLLNLIGAFMFHIKVRESLVITNYGFILGPVIGYVLDQAIGSDAGFRHVFTLRGFKYALGMMIGGNFLRYIITVFLDLFISNPLQDIMKRQVKRAGVIAALENNDGKSRCLQRYDHIIAVNYPSILQSIVAFITFQAYTNQTRFAWAYPAATLDRELRIPPGSIMLATAASGVMYLIFYSVMDSFSDRNYYDVNTKLIYVVCVIMLLFALNQTESIEAPVEGEEDNNLTGFLGDIKWMLGCLMLAAFILYGLVYPIFTRLGCCGKGRRTRKDLEEDEDHLIDAPQELCFSEPLLDAIADRLQQRCFTGSSCISTRKRNSNSSDMWCSRRDRKSRCSRKRRSH